MTAPIENQPGPGTAEDQLLRRAGQAEAEQARLGRRAGWLAHLRLILFLTAAGCAVAGLWRLDRPSVGLLVVAGLALVGFVAGVVIHDRVERALALAIGLAGINRQGLARLARDWDGLDPGPAEVAPGSTEPGALERAGDLDLFGRGSLFHLVCAANTAAGRECLARWLLEPAGPDRVAERQQAVGELASRLDFRQELQWLGERLAADDLDLAPVLAWAESEPWLRPRSWLVWLTRGLGLATLGLLAADLTGLLGPPLWLALAVVNLVWTAAYAGRLSRSFGAVSGKARAFESYAALFAALERQGFESRALREQQARTRTQGLSAARQMARLEGILGFADLRRSAMAWLPIQALCLWDFLWLERLERWQEQAGRAVRAWLDALGQVEALASLAGLAHLHPDWAMPRVEAGAQGEIDARALGHPLLPPGRCVTNDVQLGPPGTVLLVTGSNMAGKSTLLRAVGVNLMLAQAGAPVCARALRLPPVRLGTSFRVSDSLAQGVSTFMAELQRLRQVVDLAERATGDGQPRAVFLLDEILLGTNVRERQVAVQRVLTRLLDLGAIGAVATHDLSLAEAPGLKQACRPVHFSERFEPGPDGAEQMTFDYRLRPGVTPTSNALKLLRLVGLDDPDADQATE